MAKDPVAILLEMERTLQVKPIPTANPPLIELQSYLRWRGHCKGEKVCRRDRILYEIPNKSIGKNEEMKKDEHGCL